MKTPITALALIFLLTSTISCGLFNSDRLRASDGTLKSLHDIDYNNRIVTMDNNLYMDDCARSTDNHISKKGEVWVGHYISDCLMEEAFIGSEFHVKQLVKTLNLMPSEQLSALKDFNRFRGSEVFETLLKKANNFECFETEDRSSFKGFTAGLILSQMIKQIGGESPKLYYTKNITSKSKLDNTDCYGLTKTAEDYFIVLSEAYNSGLVTLKNFGEN